MGAGVWVLVVALVLSIAFGVFRALTDGRFRGTHRIRGASAETPAVVDSVLEGTPWAGELGERFTLLQFSSAFCSPCRVARRVLGEVADLVPGTRHLEIDAEQHLELVRRLGVLRTPTTLILDSGGSEVTRASGAPTKAQVLGVLDRS